MARTEPQLIINVTHGTVACRRVVIADRPVSRMRGLLGKSGLPAGEGLLLTPAPSIHTAFMRFAIDAVLLDSELRVLKLAAHLGPWRAAGARRAKAVLELAGGEIERVGLHVDDQLEIQEGAVVDQASTAAHRDPQDPARVLLVAADRRFRMFASTSLEQCGYHVTVRTGSTGIAELAARECIDVAVIDATPSLIAATQEASRLQAALPLLGIVTVSDDPSPGLSAFPVLPRWGSLGSLCAAIEQARGDRRLDEDRHAGR
jgi:uncharacterized protein